MDLSFKSEVKGKMTEMKAKCGHCGSANVYGMTRVVGYFSRVDNWNASKKAELADRQKGDYKVC